MVNLHLSGQFRARAWADACFPHRSHHLVAAVPPSPQRAAAARPADTGQASVVMSYDVVLRHHRRRDAALPPERTASLRLHGRALRGREPTAGAPGTWPRGAVRASRFLGGTRAE